MLKDTKSQVRSDCKATTKWPCHNVHIWTITLDMTAMDFQKEYVGDVGLDKESRPRMRMSSSTN